MLFKIPQTDKDTQNTSSLDFQPTNTQKSIVLLTLSQTENTPPHAYFLLCFNPQNQNISVTRFFSQTVLSGPDQSKLILGECYQKNGISGASQALSDYFNADISKYISFTNKTAMGLLENLNPALINVKYPLSQIDKKKDIYIKIDSGRQLLSSSALLDFFACTAFRGGVSETLFETANALASLIQRNAQIFSQAGGSEAEKYILSECNTNLTALDFEKNREILDYIFKNPNAAFVLAADGEYKNEQTEFRLESVSLNNIKTFYSQN